MLWFASIASADQVVRGRPLIVTGIARDAAGDVFLAAPNKNSVVKATPDGSGGYTTTTVDTNLDHPNGVAVDGSGNVFIADTNNNRVVEDKPDGSGHYTQTVVDTLVSGPQGVAVDGSGDVFVADTSNNRVVKDTPDGSGGYNGSLVAGGLNSPYGVAVDGSGNVFVADTGNGRVLEEKPDGGGYTGSLVKGGLAFPYGVAVDGSGDVYTFTSTPRIPSIGWLVKETPDGSGGYSQSVLSTAVTFPRGIAVEGSDDVLVSEPVLQKIVRVTPGGCGCPQNVIDTGVLYPLGVAVDGSGDVFIADAGTNEVSEEKPDGSGGYNHVVVKGALNGPGGVAVDRAGNVFIADTYDNRVLEEKRNRSGGYTTVTVDTGLSSPMGIAVDSSGHVFVADTGNSQVVEEKPNGSGGFTPAVIDTDLSHPYGVAVDRSGNVFVTDSGNNRVVKDAPDGSGGYARQSTVDSAVSDPRGIAVDGLGYLFVSDNGDEQVVADKPNRDGTYSQSVVNDYTDTPNGIAVDRSGNVFLGDSYGVREHVNSLTSVSVGARLDPSGTYTVTATALNEWGERMPAYADSSPTWSDTASELGSQTPAPFVSGTSVSRGVTLPTPTRGDTLSVTTDAVTGTSAPFDVAGPLAKFATSIRGAAAAGQPTTIVVHAEDTAGSVIRNYVASPSWSDSSGQLAASPAAFSGGVSTTTATFANPYHRDQITVTDGSVSSQGGPFNVVGPLAKFVIARQGVPTAGQSFTVNVYAEDAVGTVVRDYGGSPTWSDASGTLSGSPDAFSNGVSTNTVTISSAYKGDRITVTDGSVSTEGGAFNVVGPLAKFVIPVHGPLTVDQGITPLVYAEDSLGDVIRNYSGSPSWSDLPGQVFGSPEPFYNGISTNSVAWGFPYNRDQITVTDGSVSSQSNRFTINS
jgi:streptogramin lyase